MRFPPSFSLKMEKFLLLSLSSSLFFLLQFQTLTLVLSLTPDGLSLLALKAAVDSFPGDTFSDWNENDTNPCHWSGIACMNIAGDSDPRVVGITVSGRNLHGYIPSELGALLYLRRLNLHGNNFTGSIPSQLFNASSLHSIFLYDNDLTGKLPGEICKIPRLQNLDLSRNSLSGELPTGISNCRQLQRLILHDNFFTGKIPSGIGSLKNLVQLDLSANRLNGTIPSELGQLDSLSGTLNLSFNHFSGEIPKSLSKLPITVSFDLRHNNLTGQIPQEGSFENQGPTAFLNNPLLCGFPLQTPCRNSTPGSPDIQIPVPVSGNPGKKRLKPGVIIAISFADAAGVAIIGLILVFLYWKTKDNRSCSCTTKGQLGGKGKFGISNCFCRKGSDPGEMSETGSEKGAEGDLVTMDKGFNFDLDELLRASAYVLGKSGLGIVYKVVLGNGIPVAVRRLGEGGTQRYKEFTAEIQAIGRIKHPNIVKLRAYYWAPDEKLLICDFISNGNLGSALHGRTGQASAKLSWSTRLKIAKGTACGLAHLHECSPRKFVHGDIKPSNILLDSNYQPYISDFGLNRLVSIAGSSPSSSNSGGFIGGAFPYGKQIQANGASTSKPSGIHYRAPEARVAGNRPTQKWDVYSFGVVLLELLTGKSPEYQYPAGDGDLVMWVRKGFEEENPLSEMVDPALLQEVHAKKEVIGVFHVALACTDDDPENRPRMKTASENLERIGA